MRYFPFPNLTTILLFTLLHQCQISDPEHKLKTYEIENYTGFIARDFFQVIVEIPIEPSDKTILQIREICKEQSIYKRNRIALPILREIASSNSINQKRYKKNNTEKHQEELPSFEAKSVSKTKFIDSKTHLQEFDWFFEKLFLYKEDYSQKDKCKFIYRNISPNLYEKVENTKLILPQKPQETFQKEETQAPQNPNLPTIPTGGSVR